VGRLPEFLTCGSKSLSDMGQDNKSLGYFKHKLKTSLYQHDQKNFIGEKTDCS
jgi:hypothetical protein